MEYPENFDELIDEMIDNLREVFGIEIEDREEVIRGIKEFNELMESSRDQNSTE